MLPMKRSWSENMRATSHRGSMGIDLGVCYGSTRGEIVGQRASMEVGCVARPDRIVETDLTPVFRRENYRLDRKEGKAEDTSDHFQQHP
jgi:hypothetical protein